MCSSSAALLIEPSDFGISTLMPFVPGLTTWCVSPATTSKARAGSTVRFVATTAALQTEDSVAGLGAIFATEDLFGACFGAEFVVAEGVDEEAAKAGVGLEEAAGLASDATGPSASTESSRPNQNSRS